MSATVPSGAARRVLDAQALQLVVVVRARGQRRQLLLADAQLHARGSASASSMESTPSSFSTKRPLCGQQDVDLDLARAAARRRDVGAAQRREAVGPVGEGLHEHLALAPLRLHHAADGHQVREGRAVISPTISMSHSMPRRRADRLEQRAQGVRGAALRGR